MQRLTVIIALLAAFVFPAAAADDNPFNVDVFFGWDGYYRPTEWTPVEIEVSSEIDEFFGGIMQLSAKQDGLNTMNISHDFALTPGLPQFIPLVTKFAFNAEKCQARLIDSKRRRVVWKEDYGFWDYNQQKQVKAVKENDMLIGLIGKRKFDLFKLPDKTQCAFSGKKHLTRSKGEICIGDKRPKMAPWDWTGYESLDLLVLYAPDWSQFKKQQLTAISQWVSKGGRLLLIPGDQPIEKENPINSILPYSINDTREITLTPADLSTLKLNPSEPETVNARPIFIEGKSPLYKVSNSQTGQCLFVSAKVGFGTVGIFSLDPSDLSARQINNSTHFWVNTVKLMLESKPATFKSDFKPVAAKKNPRRYGGYGYNDLNNLSMANIRTIEMRENSQDIPANYQYYQTGLSQTGSNAVMEYLYNIAEMRPLGIWPVIFLLLLLAVLVGPVDYIVLKRKDILPLTWVTSAFWIILFSFGAYHGVQALRGGSLQMRHVTILDGIQTIRGDGSRTTTDAWATNFAAVFAPKSDEYNIVDERENQWYSAISPAERQVYSFRGQSSSKQIYCYQHDGSNMPTSMPINIWTMQCLINESPAGQIPISATCTVNGNNVTVKIDNYSSEQLKEGYILFKGNRFLEFSAVGPKQTKEFSGRLRGGKNWDFSISQINSNQYGYSRNFVERELEVEKTFSAQGCLERSRAMKDFLAEGAAVVCAKYEDVPTPYKLENKKCEYKHIQLVRLVIFPEQKSKDIAYDTN